MKMLRVRNLIKTSPQFSSAQTLLSLFDLGSLSATVGISMGNTNGNFLVYTGPNSKDIIKGMERITAKFSWA